MNIKTYTILHLKAIICCTILTLVISMAFTFTLRADEGNASLERSTKAIAQAKEELEQERIRISKEDERLNGLVNKLHSERDKLSDAVIDLKISVRRQKESLSAVEKSVNHLKDDARGKEEILNQVHTLLSGAAGELNGLVKTLPPSSRRQQQIKTLNKLIDNTVSDSAEATIEDTKELFKIVLEVINEGQDIELYVGQVKTEHGVLEKSAIMRIGHIATAYVSSDIGRIGLKVKSIEGDEGFRWKEDLPRNQRKKIMHALDTMKNHEEGTVAFPVDVTQEIQLQKKSGSPGVFGFLVSGGPVMIPLAIVTLVALILIIERLFFFRKERSMHDHLMGDIISLCAEGRHDEAEDICKKHEGPIARTLAACISRREQGVSAMEDSVQESIMHEIPRLEHFLPAIGVLAAVAPLLGLLGTVTGMINTFHMITIFGNSSPGLMAGGISQALITTATGLVIAIPVLLAHNYLSTKSDGIICDIERYAATVFNALANQNYCSEKEDKQNA
jgi:biopolymer transport protein ExbB